MTCMEFISLWLKRRAGKKEYARVLAAALKDRHLGDAEKESLKGIISRFNLRTNDTLKIKRGALSSVFDSLASDSRITEEERLELQNIANFFGRPLDDLGFDQERFNKFHALAQIESGVLPKVVISVDPNIVLKKGEQLHWVCPAAMMKRTRTTRAVNFGGITGSIKIAPGIRFRVGSLAVGRVTTEDIKREDTGSLWITNSRVGFKGLRKHFAVPFSKISSFEIIEGVLHVFKEGRENPYLVFLADYDIPCSIISLILNGDSTKGSIQAG